MLTLAIIMLILNCLFLGVSLVNAEVLEETPEMFCVEATAYCTGATTATGCKVRQGIIAGKPEWFGKVAAVYECDNGNIGQFIGYYECLDTGGEAIKNGKVIDIYNPSYEWCLQFGRQKVFIHLIDGEG